MSGAILLSEPTGELALFAAAGYTLFAIDDLAVDLVYFVRRRWRAPGGNGGGAGARTVRGGGGDADPADLKPAQRRGRGVGRRAAGALPARRRAAPDVARRHQDARARRLSPAPCRERGAGIGTGADAGGRFLAGGHVSRYMRSDIFSGFSRLPWFCRAGAASLPGDEPWTFTSPSPDCRSMRC